MHSLQPKLCRGNESTRTSAVLSQPCTLSFFIVAYFWTTWNKTAEKLPLSLDCRLLEWRAWFWSPQAHRKPPEEGCEREPCSCNCQMGRWNQGETNKGKSEPRFMKRKGFDKGWWVKSSTSVTNPRVETRNCSCRFTKDTAAQAASQEPKFEGSNPKRCLSMSF